ncbi:MAG: two pore domain potassium channel family protein [Deltaproteobacteria bacterium]|nr:two pore domain potassium channel family protein [Deltaproteobacteria bacterium]
MNKNGISYLPWRALARHHPSAFLFAAQLMSLVLYTVLDGSTGGRALLGAFGVLVLTLVVWVINRGRTTRWVVWVLVAPAVVLSLLSALFVDPNLLIWSSLLEAVIYFYAAGSLIAYMMKDYRVTSDELFAAGATFTLFAWGFAFAYQVCQSLFPGSFAGGTYPGQQRTFIELLSLSFTNLSATGLGDVLPVTPLARVLVMLEQFAGVGYIVLVVSRLIGLTLVRQKGKGTS